METLLVTQLQKTQPHSPPLKVEDIICKPKEQHAADGEQGGKVLRESCMRKGLGEVNEMLAEWNTKEQEHHHQEHCAAHHPH